MTDPHAGCTHAHPSTRPKHPRTHAPGAVTIVALDFVVAAGAAAEAATRPVAAGAAVAGAPARQQGVGDSGVRAGTLIASEHAASEHVCMHEDKAGGSGAAAPQWRVTLGAMRPATPRSNRKGHKYGSGSRGGAAHAREHSWQPPGCFARRQGRAQRAYGRVGQAGGGPRCALCKVVRPGSTPASPKSKPMH